MALSSTQLHKDFKIQLPFHRPKIIKKAMPANVFVFITEIDTKAQNWVLMIHTAIVIAQRVVQHTSFTQQHRAVDAISDIFKNSELASMVG